jgi:hypothetical protein
MRRNDDIKRGNCTRCHKSGHVRRDCKEPKSKWEEKFGKPVLLLAPDLLPLFMPNPPLSPSSASDSDEDDTPTFTPLHYRLTIDDGSDDEDLPAFNDIIAGLWEQETPI